MSVGAEASEQIVRMLLSSGEVVLRLSGSLLKNVGAASLAALHKKGYKVHGRTSYKKIMNQHKDIQKFVMSDEQFKAFKKVAVKYKVLYAGIKLKHNANKAVDLVIPTCDLEKANMAFDAMGFVPERKRDSFVHEEAADGKKKESQSRQSSRDTRQRQTSSSNIDQPATMKTNEKPSIEKKLQGFRSQVDKKRHATRTRTKSKSHSK